MAGGRRRVVSLGRDCPTNGKLDGCVIEKAVHGGKEKQRKGAHVVLVTAQALMERAYARGRLMGEDGCI